MKRGVWIVAALVGLAGPAGWLVTDQLESNNHFCIACHLESDLPLHQEKMDNFSATPPTSLVAFHRTDEADFLCIDCHGGASLRNKLRVKAVAARDAAAYLLGRFEEPVSMDHPLWDEDCARCHAEIEVSGPDDFHALEVHNLPGFEFRCVDCHQAHPVAGRAEFAFLQRDHVLAVCRNCHEEY